MHGALGELFDEIGWAGGAITVLTGTTVTQCREDRQKFESMRLDIQDKLIGGSLLDEYLEDKGGLAWVLISDYATVYY